MSEANHRLTYTDRLGAKARAVRKPGDETPQHRAAGSHAVRLIPPVALGLGTAFPKRQLRMAQKLREFLLLPRVPCHLFLACSFLATLGQKAILELPDGLLVGRFL